MMNKRDYRTEIARFHNEIPAILAQEEFANYCERDRQYDQDKQNQDDEWIENNG